MNRLCALATLLLGSVGSVHASTITLTNLPTGQFVTSGGGAVPNGSLVVLGYFDDLEANIGTIRNGALTLEKVAEIQGLFNAVGDLSSDAGSGSGVLTTASLGNPAADGRVFGQITEVNSGGTYVPATYTSASDSMMYTTKMAIWALNGPTIETSTEMGIFIVDGTQWDIPANPIVALTMNPAAPGITVDALRGSVTAPGVLALEAPIPEPSASLFALLGAFGLIFRRRR